MNTSILAAVVLLAQGSAEDLYRKMAKAVGEAESLTATFKAEVRSESGGASRQAAVEAGVRLKGAAKVKVEAATTIDGKTSRSALVSDGRRTVEVEGDRPKDPTDAVADHGRRLAAGLRAVGFAGFALTASQIRFEKRNVNDLPDLDPLLTLEGWESKGEETVGGAAAQVVAYRAVVKGGPTWSVKVWIATATSLPLKRELEAEVEGGKVTIVETSSVDVATGLKDEEFVPPERK